MPVLFKGTHSPAKGNRVPFVLSPVIFAASLAFVSFSVSAQLLDKPDTDELNQLSAAGLTAFSLVLLDEYTPDISESPQAWMEWQKNKVLAYQQSRQWQRIIQLADAIPQGAPPGYRSWLQVQIIRAYLFLGDGESARDLLLAQLWGQDESAVVPQQDRVSQLRRLVVQSYLVEGRTRDAMSATVRFDQDYRANAQDPVWRALKGRVLIVGNRPDKAALLTVANETPLGQAVYALARLKGLAPLDQGMLQSVIASLNSSQLDQALRQELFASALDKATAISDWPERIAALDKLSRINDISSARMTALADALWHAYAEYGQQVANRLQLLLGDFNPWFDAADRLSESSPAEAQALFAYLVLRSADAGVQTRAHERFVATLAARQAGLMRLLYLSSSQFSHDVSALPLVVMYRLVDMALDDGDLGLASKLMSQLDAPDGVDLAEWQLRRARVQILAGAPEYGADLLQQMVATSHLNSRQIEYLIRVVFDLQNSQQYQAAYDILAVLLPNVPDLILHREVLFLMADSLASLHQHAASARLYLRSAMLDAGNMDDAWGQAARYQAAQAMLRLGLVDDALKLYRELYALAESPDRRALLLREIQFYSLH